MNRICLVKPFWDILANAIAALIAAFFLRPLLVGGPISIILAAGAAPFLQAMLRPVVKGFPGYLVEIGNRGFEQPLIFLFMPAIVLGERMFRVFPFSLMPVMARRPTRRALSRRRRKVAV